MYIPPPVDPANIRPMYKCETVVPFRMHSQNNWKFREKKRIDYNSVAAAITNIALYSGKWRVLCALFIVADSCLSCEILSSHNSPESESFINKKILNPAYRMQPVIKHFSAYSPFRECALLYSSIYIWRIVIAVHVKYWWRMYYILFSFLVCSFWRAIPHEL